MSTAEEQGSCGNCGRRRAVSDLDGAGWCGLCRQMVVTRATFIAHTVAGLVALAVAIWIVMGVHPGPRFVLVWAILIGAIYFFLFRLTRRVAFEVVRTRGVRPPEEE